jgi:hypothetical protein
VTGEDWSNLIMTGSDIGLQWFATAQQVPIAQQRPTSVVEAIAGSDITRGAPVAATGGTLIVLAVVVVGAILIFRR